MQWTQYIVKRGRVNAPLGALFQKDGDVRITGDRTFHPGDHVNVFFAEDKSAIGFRKAGRGQRGTHKVHRHNNCTYKICTSGVVHAIGVKPMNGTRYPVIKADGMLVVKFAGGGNAPSKD